MTAPRPMAIGGDAILLGNDDRGRRGSAYVIELAPDFPSPRGAPKAD